MKSEERVDKWLMIAKNNQKHWQHLISKLKKKPVNEIDILFHKYHEKAFREINCLFCANCCKTTGPRILNSDIQRLSKVLKMRPGTFVKEYLKTDEDGDFVFKCLPCPFLDQENHCQIYEHRPAACREYPHTNRKRMYQLLDLSLKNSLICPAVSLIFERISKETGW